MLGLSDLPRYCVLLEAELLRVFSPVADRGGIRGPQQPSRRVCIYMANNVIT